MKEMIGRILGEKYRIIRLVGRGGMGIVYEAEHMLLHRRVAVKVLLPVYASKAHSIRRFIREGQAASAIDHPNILDIKDLCQDSDGTVYIVMELLSGQSLKQLLDQRRVLPLDRVVNITMELLSGLQAAHAKGVIHRDIKPENIFISSVAGREQIKIVDFGVAKFMETTTVSPSLTATGSVPGTPFYMAPELAKGSKTADEQTDIWSLGVVMYEMLTGSVPFGGDNYNEVIGQILLTPLRPVQEISADVPDGLAAVVHKALAKDKQHRYKGAHEMVEALLPFRGTSAMEPRTTDVLERRDGVALSECDSMSRLHSESELMDITISRPSSLPRRSYRKRYAAAAVSVVIVASAAFAGIFFAETGDGTVAQRIEPVIPARDDAPPVPAEIVDAPVQSATRPTLAEAETISVGLSGLLSKSEITLNGEQQALPLTIPKSQNPVDLMITAGGYLPYRKSIVPSHDLNLFIKMERSPKRETKSKKTDRQSSPNVNQTWRSNPFAAE